MLLMWWYKWSIGILWIFISVVLKWDRRQYTVESRHNAVQFITISHTALWWQQQNVNSQQMPYILPSRTSYVVANWWRYKGCSSCKGGASYASWGRINYCQIKWLLLKYVSTGNILHQCDESWQMVMHPTSCIIIFSDTCTYNRDRWYHLVYSIQPVQVVLRQIDICKTFCWSYMQYLWLTTAKRG